MSDDTPRFALPLLAAGQAQKEVLHNEAITTLERLVQPVVETIGDNAPPSAPAEGASWIVGASASGAWAGQAGAIAGWTEGGWRFTPASEGMLVYNKATSLEARYAGGRWTEGRPQVEAIYVGGEVVIGGRQSPIAPPIGGSVVDAESRAAVSAILAALRAHGLIAT